MKPHAKRVTLIHSARAGWGDLSQRALRQGLERGGYEVRTASPEHALSASLGKKCDAVIAAGGDGTVLRVARRLVHKNVPLIILPLGTANNLARSVGMDPSIECALSTLASPRERYLDIGLVTGSWGERYFCESAGVGWFSDALSGAVGPKDKKNALAMLAKHLEKYEAKEWKVSIDGRDAPGKYVLVDVMNAKMLGPNLQLAPLADPFDGKLDVVLVTSKEKPKLMLYLEALQKDPASRPPRFRVIRAKHVNFELRGPLKHVRIDGTVRPKRGAIESHFAEVRLLPGAVRLWLAPQAARRAKEPAGELACKASKHQGVT